MLFEAFDSIYLRTGTSKEALSVSARPEIADVRQVLDEYGGATYEDGLYRFLSSHDAPRWTQALERFFPTESGDVEAFAQDWQGNLFGYRDRSNPAVLLFQIGSGDVFEISESITAFHNEELVEHPEEALSISLWREWRLNESWSLNSDDCVAYKNPLFLGGEVAIQNLTRANVEVYWETIGQLLAQVRDLPEGTAVSHIKLQIQSE